MRGLLILHALLVGILLPACFAIAADNVPHIPRVTVAPVIDGEIGPQEWTGAQQYSLSYETWPLDDIPAEADTEAMLVEDGEYLYVAIIAHDPEPEKIRAYYRDRDSAWDDDWSGIIIDTFNDERRGFEFFVNPLGVQMDLINDDIVRSEDSSWNALWDSAGQITDDGYVVEMRIPLHQLRFTEGLAEQTWGLDILRAYPRDRRHTFSINKLDRDISCFLCQIQKVRGFANLVQQPNLVVVPTVTSAYTRARPATPGSGGWDSSFDGEAGIDVRWGINQDIFLNATLNPDFSQVEADVAQLDVNNTFSLFFPERRDFFLEGADYFNTQANLVHTRNIAAPDYGVKLTGKRDNTTFAVFYANDTSTSFLIPGSQRSEVAHLDESSQNAALRLRQDFGSRVSVGFLGTGRAATEYSNVLASIDGNFRLGDSDRISVQLMTSATEYPASVQTGNDQKADIADSAYTVSYNHNDNEWDWVARYQEFGDEFRADLGFVNQVDYRRTFVGAWRRWRFGPESRFSQVRIGGDWLKSWSESGQRLEDLHELSINADGPWQTYMFMGVGHRERLYNNQYFNERWLDTYVQSRPRAGVSVAMGMNFARAVDFANTRMGDLLTLRPQATLQLGRQLQLRLQHNFQTMKVAGGRLFATHLSDMRATWQFGLRSFVRLTVQYSATKRDQDLYLSAVDHHARSLTTQLLYSYKLNAQTRFFVGYSDTGLDNDMLDGLRQTNRTLFTKFSYAWDPF